MRRRHRRAAEEGPSGSIARAGVGLANARDRAEDVDAHRSEIGLDEYVRRRRALAAKASQNVLVGRRDEFLERLDRRRGGFSGCSQRCPVVLANHNCWQVVAAQPVFCHGDRITRDIVNHKHTHSADRDRVAHFSTEGARAAIDDRELAGSAWIDARAASTVRVEKIVRGGGKGRKLPDGRTNRSSTALRICERLADEMLVCTRADRDDLGRPAG